MRHIRNLATLATALTIVILVAWGCDVLHSARVGGMTGYVDGTDGHRDLNAVTFSVEPLAGLERPSPERRVHPGAWVLLAEHEAAVSILTAERDEYASMLSEWEGHVCEPGGEHVAEQHHPSWWEDAEFLAWLAATAMALVGLWVGRKPLAKHARRVLRRGGAAE